VQGAFMRNRPLQLQVRGGRDNRIRVVHHRAATRTSNPQPAVKPSSAKAATITNAGVGDKRKDQVRACNLGFCKASPRGKSGRRKGVRCRALVSMDAAGRLLGMPTS
jgi:hypothetical protein